MQCLLFWFSYIGPDPMPLANRGRGETVGVPKLQGARSHLAPSCKRVPTHNLSTSSHSDFRSERKTGRVLALGAHQEAHQREAHIGIIAQMHLLRFTVKY